MSKQIEKDFSEFPQDAKVDFSDGHWSWGRGGRPLGDWDFSISYTDDDLTQTRWKLPPCISTMLVSSERHGKEEAQRKIRSALGI